ncbi:MAG: DUF1549 domain-containing protein, partial [Rubripirellula sp.]
MFSRSRTFLGALSLLLPSLMAWSQEIDFDSQVRPILSDKCFPCHGPDEATREAGLRLDTAEGAHEDLGGYSAFRAGDLEGSEGLRRIGSDDPDEIMPPPESKLELTGAEKETLQRWVESGAKWSEHWSFVTPREPDVPDDPSGWSRNDVDRFILARATIAGLERSPEASPETLVRRLFLDLTGLPPSPADVRQYLEDKSPRAYEDLVDRLLASPRYGERMAWDWMDAARYADTDGFQGDPTRTMWPWRDWLVTALNDNLPFDQFTIEMLAGDLIPDATAEQVLASGFNRNHMFNGEGGRIAEETRVENVFDRCETTGTVWMGLTMTCCRCHDHKYDALSQKEYFQLYAFFDNTSESGKSGRGKTEPVIQYLRPELRTRREVVEASLGSLKKRIDEPISALDTAQEKWGREIIAAMGDSGGNSTMGPWWQLGPLKGGPRQLFDKDQGPEAKVDLAKAVGEASWEKKADVKDAVVNSLPSTLGATYFYRKIQSPEQRTMSLSLGSDDAIKVFCNGE